MANAARAATGRSAARTADRAAAAKANPKADPQRESGTAGAQSLRRALGLLRLVAERHEEGVKLAEIVETTGLQRPTAHRLLAALTEEQFVERGDDRLYRLGVEAMNLGFASLRRAPLVDACRPALQQLARTVGDTLFLVVRQGDYAYCLHREEGPYPVKVFTTNVGERRLLGIGAGGLALLARLADDEIAALHARHAADYRAAGFTLAALLKAAAQTRRRGHAETVNSITVGIVGVGVAFRIGTQAWAAVSVGAIDSRLPAARRAEVAKALRAVLGEDGRALSAGVQPR